MNLINAKALVCYQWDDPIEDNDRKQEIEDEEMNADEPKKPEEPEEDKEESPPLLMFNWLIFELELIKVLS